MLRQAQFMSSAGSGGERRPEGPARRIVRIVNPFVFTFCLACVWLGMREILELGGFVASGGPYVVAHEAPGWVWVIPLSIMLMVGSMLTAAFTDFRSGSPNFMLFSWSMLFVSLGWNFLEYGFGIGKGGGVAWGWVVCAGLFLSMGLLPLVPATSMLVRWTRAASRRSVSRSGDSGNPAMEADGHEWTGFIAQAVMAAAGAALGAAFFGGLSS